MLTAVFFFTIAASYGQTPSAVTGKVTDSTGKGIENVTVRIKGSKGATVTNAGGYSSFLSRVPVRLWYFRLWALLHRRRGRHRVRSMSLFSVLSTICRT
ncbi:hypothetical protein ACQ86N_10180 [Puia sp. P3]|uniref:hypothetical protein n=1 Tax=Puia sp. P3 TaxID=3423952 RepID=UPI003D673DBC